MAEPTDEHDALSEAVLHATQGDELAFRIIYRRIQPRLSRYLRTIAGYHEAEDIAAETWSTVAQDLPDFRGGFDGFRAWVFKIAHNRARHHLRTANARGRRHAPLEDIHHTPPSEDPATRAIDTLSADRATSLIRQLPPDQAQAVMLHVVLGLSATAAAQVLGKRPGAVRTNCHRGLRRLATLLKDPSARPFATVGAHFLPRPHDG